MSNQLKYKWGVYNNSLPNLIRGIHERIFTVETDGVRHEPYQPEMDATQDLLQFRREVVRACAPTAKLTVQQFIDSRPSRTRKLYTNAAKSLENREICRNDANWDVFIKAEKDTKRGAPRIIYPRGPRYNFV